RAALGAEAPRARRRASPRRWPPRRPSAARAAARRPRPTPPTRRRRQRARGSGSQGHELARDDIVGLAHAQDLDQLARVLEAAEVGAVIDAFLREGGGEAGDGLELLERRLVEVDARDHRPRRRLRERDLDLLPVAQPSGVVGQLRRVGVGAQAARSGDGVEDAVAAGQAVEAWVLYRPDDVNQQTWVGAQVEDRVAD